VSVRWERRGPAAWITFDRPEAHNAMTFDMYEELFALCSRADEDASVQVVVLRGAGRKAFVAGTDIRHFTTFSSGEDGVRYEAAIDRVVDRVEAVRVPTIAFVDGYAMGSGLALAAACDLRLVTVGARFGMPIARTVGNCLSMGNYARLAALLGEARVKDLIFTARAVEADEALAIGLATRLVSSEEEVVSMCELLASHAAVTMRVTKQALRRLRVVPDGDDLVRETYGSEEFRERVAAFLSR
jgi:enoyl-CoA hydratase/carnithine racemase